MKVEVDYSKYDLVLSATQLQMFAKCNRKWVGIYAHKLGKEPATRAMMIGTCIHSICERYQKQEPTYPDGWDLLENKERLNERERVMVQGMIEEAIQRGVLRSYAGGLAEMSFVYELPIAEGKVAIIGAIDVFGKGLISDYKSRKNKNYKLSAEELQQDPQVLIYGLVHNREYPGVPVRFEHRNLYKEEPPGKRAEIVTTSPISEAALLDWRDSYLIPMAREMLALKKAKDGLRWHDLTAANHRDICKEYNKACAFTAHCFQNTSPLKHEETVGFFDKMKRPAASAQTAAAAPADEPASQQAAAAQPAAQSTPSTTTSTVSSLLNGRRSGAPSPRPAPAAQVTDESHRVKAAPAAEKAAPAQPAEKVTTAPWADMGCETCGSSGVVEIDGVPRPCPSCVSTARGRGVPSPSGYAIVPTENAWVVTAKPEMAEVFAEMFGPDVIGPFEVARPKPPQAAEPEPEPAAAAEQEAPPKARKARKAAAEPAATEPRAPLPTILLCRGCMPLNVTAVPFQSIFDIAAAALAEMRGKRSFFEIEDVFRRRDDLRLVVERVVSGLFEGRESSEIFVYVPERTGPDEDAFYRYLSTYRGGLASIVVILGTSS